MPASSRAALYLRTLSNFRGGQLWYLPLRSIQAGLPVWVRRRSAEIEEGRLPALQRALQGANFIADDRRLAAAAEIVQGRFTFLRHTEPVAAIDWRRRYPDAHWTGRLHAFDWATDLAWAAAATNRPEYFSALQALLEQWLARAGSGQGPGWNPQAVSSRALNLSRIYLILGAAAPQRFARTLADTAISHLAWLDGRLDYHLGSHYLQRNFHALAVGGLVFGGARASRWRTTALPALWAQLMEQVLPDGGHVERSPLVQAEALADFLEVVALSRGRGMEVGGDVRDRLGKMLLAHALLSREDGTLHLFNDAANGAGPSRRELLEGGAHLLRVPAPAPHGPFALDRSGYFGLVDATDGRRLVIDCGEPGPRHQSRHAHCDVLSFELDLAGRPVVVDAGVSGFEGDPWREYVRSTRAHNTVSVDGQEQSEIWDTWRMARRARAVPGPRFFDGVTYRFEGACRPFWDRNVEHQRVMELCEESLGVGDVVRGAEGARVTSHLHLHPAFTLRPSGSGFLARAGGVEVLIEPYGVDAVEISSAARDPMQGWHCPEFGLALPALALDFHVLHNDHRVFGYRITRVGGATAADRATDEPG